MIQLLSRFASQPWLMEPHWFRVAYNIVTRQDPIKGLDGEFALSIQKRALSLGNGEKKDLRFVERRGDVAVLHIRGPIVRYAGMMELSADVRSLETYAKEFKALQNDPGVRTIVLNIDSPGGEAAGIAEFAEYVRQSNKKVVAYVDDLCASAAYWIAAATDGIYASQTAFVGSIGVVFTVVDDTEKLKKQGLERIEIVSSTSPKKHPDIKSAEGRKQIQKWADELADRFISAVARYRGVSTEDVVEKFGGVDILIAQAAKDAGMIDEVSTFEQLMKNLQKGEQMELSAKRLKDEFPEVYAEVFELGASMERERIRSIESLGQFVGYEELVTQMKFDGKSTAEMVELAIFRAEREKRAQLKSEYDQDGQKAAALLAEAGTGIGEPRNETPDDEQKSAKLPSPFVKALEKLKGGK